jgi:hypothetical protein
MIDRATRGRDSDITLMNATGLSGLSKHDVKFRRYDAHIRLLYGHEDKIVYMNLASLTHPLRRPRRAWSPSHFETSPMPITIHRYVSSTMKLLLPLLTLLAGVSAQPRSAPTTPDIEAIDYDHEGAPLRGFLTTPQGVDSSSPVPAVSIFNVFGR